MILPCSCKNLGQDELHGKGQRVHNWCAGSTKNASKRGWRCTVCAAFKDEGQVKGRVPA